jgi:isoamylase
MTGFALDRIDTYPTRTIGGYAVRMGRPVPFGATRAEGGVNFSVYSNRASRMVLVLFRPGEHHPHAELPFPAEFRIGGVFTMTVFGLDIERLEYGFRAYGPDVPEVGDRFNPNRVVSDPYATLIGGRAEWGVPPDYFDPYLYRARLPLDDFDWEGDRPLNLPFEDLVIYEAHVRGFTRHPSSEVAAPGTFAGLVEKIPYLRELGVNAVELMPIFEFDECENMRVNPVTGARLYNYWGYSTVAFCAPKSSYAATGRYGMQMDETKNLVKQLHRAGIEVILDVVFNHTAEGNELGPTISFRGLDNRTYYMLTPDGSYYNFSGTGNTVNCNNPIVRGFILDCLRYWAAEYHIDGFRFDLAAILDRGPDGTPLANPPLVESLAHDPVLRDCKLIAEAWDAGGLYQVGRFPGYRWSEWNGRYRDVVRRFLRGDAGTVGDLACAIVGSPDLYGRRGTAASINFVTAHDGFTLRDLVSYNTKHNEANGEDNQDGDNNNNSWNCGVEGPTTDPDVLALRARQHRNALVLLLASHGVPMLLAGDEVARTQHGNNNAYCQDDEAFWFDWQLTEVNADLLRFTRNLIAFRRVHPVLRRPRHPLGRQGEGYFPDVSWHGVRASTPDWSAHNRILAVMLYEAAPGGADDCVYLAANGHWEEHTVELPVLPAGLAWHLFADTAATAPADIASPGAEPRLADQTHWRLGARSTVLLIARPSVDPAIRPLK